MAIDWDQLIGAGVGGLADFFAANKLQGGLEDAVGQYAQSPVLQELRGLRGLMGTDVQGLFPDVTGYDREARTRDITQDLFNIARPQLEQQAGQTLGQDYLQGTLGLDIGGRGSPLQQAFSRNLGSEISRANVLGSQQAIQEETALRNFLLNDIQSIRQLAGEDLDVQKSLAEIAKSGELQDASMISGIGDILADFFGGGGTGSGAASGLVSGIKNLLGGGASESVLSGVEPFADIFGDSAIPIIESLGGSAGELISTFGPLSNAVEAGTGAVAGLGAGAGAGALTPELASSLSTIFETGAGSTFSTIGAGADAAGGFSFTPQSGGFFESIFGSGPTPLTGNPFSGAGAGFGGLTTALGLAAPLAIGAFNIMGKGTGPEKRAKAKKLRDALGIPDSWLETPPTPSQVEAVLQNASSEQQAHPEMQGLEQRLQSGQFLTEEERKRRQAELIAAAAAGGG